MQLPDPAFSFTIPSLHDDTTLSCRIYHPAALSKGDEIETWRKKGISIAHPYAPLGGCYDDRVVGFIAEEFLVQGFVVGTFNFRGASPSKGRTSWTGKPELDDYVSFAGFLIHYLTYLSAPSASDAPSRPSDSPSSSPTAQEQARNNDGKSQCQVVLGGYSYGSLILKHLPPVREILKLFSAAEDGSAASEILLRARRLSIQTNQDWKELVDTYRRKHSRREKGHRPHENSLSVTMGGEETSPEKRRNSHETRRSMDIGHDIHRSIKSMSLHRKKRDLSQPITETLPSNLSIPIPSTSYLLVSLPHQLVASALVPSLSGHFWSKSKPIQSTLTQHSTLAVGGDEDFCSPVKKQRAWAAALSKEAGTQFEFVEIAGAGHFWHEPGAEPQLKEALRKWAQQVASSEGQSGR